jgi:ribosomal silencing factor RsfS
MDILTTTKKNIQELNQRFFLLLENFVPNYIRYLQQPNNASIANEILHVTTVNNKIESDGFMLKNSMDMAIQASQEKTKQMNNIVDTLKTENKALKARVKKLENTSLTSIGLFDEELDWYIIQLKTIIILLIGIALSGKLFYDLQPSMKQCIVLFGIVLVLILIETAGMYTYNKIKNYTSTRKK